MIARLSLLLAMLWALFTALPAAAEPTFPPLTGRVTDAAGVLPADTAAALEAKLKALGGAVTDAPSKPTKAAKPVSPLAPASFPTLPVIKGAEFAAIGAGIKYQNRKDVMLVRLAPGTAMAGVFTRSTTRSGCVRDCQTKLATKVADGVGAAIIVNSGNSNAFTGAIGDKAVAVDPERAVAAIFDALEGAVVRGHNGGHWRRNAPIWSRTFSAVGMAPTVIAYNEVYNAIQNGVINAGENEAAGVEAMKFYEVAPSILMTRHAITIRPLCFSVKTLKKLPPDLQAAIVKAGKEAGAYGRQVESSEDGAKLDALEKAGKLKPKDAMEKLDAEFAKAQLE